MSGGFRDYTETLTAGETWTIDAVGNAIQCIAGDASFTVEPAEGGSHSLIVGRGFRYETQYSKWRITNGATTQLITLVIGDGEIVDSRTAGSVTTRETLLGNFDATPAVTVGLVSATVLVLDVTRKRARIRADWNNADEVWLNGTDDAVVGSGVPLRPGDVKEIETTELITGISGTAGQTVWVEEESQ